jgi:hypothetical protein
MWRRWRKEAAAGATTAVAQRPSAPAEWEGSTAELWAEIARLTEANRTAHDRQTERQLLRLRHLAGIRLVDHAPENPKFVAADTGALPAGDPMPEVPGSALTAGLLRAGILRDGCVLVRGLVARQRALGMADELETAYRRRTAAQRGEGGLEGYYETFDPHPRFGPVEGRSWIEHGGGLLAADSPRLAFELFEALHAADLRRIVTEYLGEPAMISIHKTTLRKAEPAVTGSWHQDGYFMGDVRSLNLWLSLSRCGDIAPGLDILPRRIEHYLANTPDTDSYFDYTISDARVREAAGDTAVLRPIFEPGDALFFDERFLHQTGSDPAMSNPRYAIENWFFGGSSFPDEYAPLAV